MVYWKHQRAGRTIYELVLRDRMQPVYFEQPREMCALLYPAHTRIDYFPTNFVAQGGKICCIGFECGDYMEAWNFETWGIEYWSKTPESLQYAREHT